MIDDPFTSTQKKVLMLTQHPQDMEPFLTIMPDVALMPVHDLQDAAALRERVADSFMACEPDVIVIDSRSPLDLPTLCRAIRAYPMGKESHVLVMTHNEQDWVTCMGLNVDDVVRVKPNEPVMASLALVMARYMRALTQRQLLAEKSKQAQTAIEIAAEYGSLLHFMDAAEKQKELTGLAALVLHHLAAKSLEAIVHVSTHDGEMLFPATGAPTTHYGIIKKLARSETRTVELERFLGFRYGAVTLLVTNAPFQDSDKYGQLKDSLAHVCAITETRAKNIIIKESIGNQHEQLLELMHIMRDASKKFHAYTHKIMLELGQQLELAATTLDLQAEDEAKLLFISSTARDKLDAVHENRDIIEGHFSELIAAVSILKALIEVPATDARNASAEQIEIF